MERKEISAILDIMKTNASVKIKAWITEFRIMKNIAFLKVNDGSTFNDLQIVITRKDHKNFDQLTSDFKLGSAIEIDGSVVQSKGKEQSVEIKSHKIIIINSTSPNYPLQKKETSREFLRSIPHLRIKTKLMRAIMRIRSTATSSVHEFFRNEGFINVATPIMTSNDGEGAGEAFEIKDSGSFFGKKVTLGVTGQLQAESYANGLGKVYTFGPTFRAEKSHTQKHLAEFWMIEPEACFYSLEEIINVAEAMIKYVTKQVRKLNQEELNYLNKISGNSLIPMLDNFIKSHLHQIDYKEAVDILSKHKSNFEEKKIFFGMDLGTEHERFLAEVIYKNPIVIKNYPKEIKAFYMAQNDDGKTVKAFDLLIPGIGELVGGSEREVIYDKLLNRLREMKIPVEDLDWYLELRKEGMPQSSGFGVGFERLVMFLTGIENIRDVIPYPRTQNRIQG